MLSNLCLRLRKIDLSRRSAMVKHLKTTCGFLKACNAFADLPSLFAALLCDSCALPFSGSASVGCQMLSVVPLPRVNNAYRE